MKLSSLLDPSLIFCNIDADKKEEVIDRMIAAIKDINDKLDVEQVKKAVAEREKLSSTIMAPGIAFPHARVEGVDDFFISIATSKDGIDVEGQKVHFMCLFIIKEAATNLYLKTMAAMSKLLCVGSSVDALVAIREEDELIEKIKSTDIEVEPTIRADDIMSTKIISLKPNNTLKEAADVFVNTGHSTIPVIDEAGKFLGLLHSIDLLKIGLPNYLSEMSDISFMANYEPFENLLKNETTATIEECYTKDIKTYMDHTPVIQIAIGLIHSHDNLAPIIDSQGILRGIITISDFLIKILRA